MKFIPSQMMKVTAVCALSGMALSAWATPPPPVRSQYAGQSKDQGDDKSKQSAPSDGEQKALAKVESSPDVAAKLVAAGEFVKKYPKSTLRSKLVGYVTQEANKAPDLTQRITQLESILTVFKEPSDADVINPILVDAYLKASRDDDGFRVAAVYLAKNPSDLAVLIQVAIEGVEQAKKNNPKFVPASQQFGGKAIEIIESGKKPDTFDDARWTDYKTRWLPTLYRSLGMLSVMTGNKADAKAKLDKAVSLDPAEPFSYVLLGTMVNEEYQKLAEQHKTLSAGPLKDTVLAQAHAKLDEVIELYAHAVGLSEGNASYQQLHDQLLEDLQAYYKYRHKGSTDGLQPLIDKYKKQ
jgi:tetratricopeptide (TPR) repeat protein